MFFDGYHHIGLKVQDMDKSLDFYVKGLGGEVTFSFPMGDSGQDIYLVDLGGHSVVELIPGGTGKPEDSPHWVHIALSCGDARAAYDMAMRAGAVCKSAPQDGMLGTMGIVNAFVKGPDGEEVEFFQVK